MLHNNKTAHTAKVWTTLLRLPTSSPKILPTARSKTQSKTNYYGICFESWFQFFSAISEAYKSGPSIVCQQIIDILISVSGEGKKSAKRRRTEPNSRKPLTRAPGTETYLNFVYYGTSICTVHLPYSTRHPHHGMASTSRYTYRLRHGWKGPCIK